jgi:hypothetical protein
MPAPGAAVADSAGSAGGLLRLVAGNANIGANSPAPGTSQNNDVHIVAGDNVWGGFNSDRWNGNIQFFGGEGQPERLRIVGDNGFVGIGTTTPSQRLDVRGSIALGNNGELRAASGEENLRIIRGQFEANGTIAVGSGFTVTRGVFGHYTVTFTTSFSGPPTATATAFTNGSNVNVVIVGLANNAVQFRVLDESGAPTDARIHFIAIGAR